MQAPRWADAGSTSSSAAVAADSGGESDAGSRPRGPGSAASSIKGDTDAESDAEMDRQAISDKYSQKWAPPQDAVTNEACRQACYQSSYRNSRDDTGNMGIFFGN